MRDPIKGAISSNLPANVVGTFSTSVQSGLQDELDLVMVISPAGETSIDNTGNTLVRRLRPRFGVVGNVVDPSTGIVKTIGMSLTADFNFSVSDEAKGKAYMKETLVAFQQRVSTWTPETITAFIESSYALGKNYSDTTAQTAAGTAAKALWISGI